ncbi:hypothetical protein SAY87_023916 [Trapa incisa]|uniref:Uncharacterized protein n=1 Tax=Trapa incisa TaxID=236973 RepID=A0AAN7QU81_9MYRT|nr:hypothetical protein SAY87_023916 [Trapa incisa]
MAMMMVMGPYSLYISYSTVSLIPAVGDSDQTADRRHLEVKQQLSLGWLFLGRCVRDAVKFHRLLPVSLPSTDTLSRSPLGTKRTPFKRQCSRTHSPPLSPSSPSLRKEKAKKKVTV